MLNTTYILPVLLMLIFFGLCIIIHEFGHFLAARLCKLHIIAFSVGFKKIWGKKINGVEYRIGCLPFGGYVDLPQIDASSDEIEDENGNPLPRANPWARIITAFAGPFFNILFALFLGIFIYIFGVPQDNVKYSEFKVREVPETSAEYKAGLRPGDRIVKLNGREFNLTWANFTRRFMLNEDNVEKITLDVIRDGQPATVSYIPEINREFAPDENVVYPFFVPEIPVIVMPEKGSPASLAGVKSGDTVLAVNGDPVYDAEHLLTATAYSNGAPITLKVKRDETEHEFTIQPKKIEGIEPRYLVGINFTSDEPVISETVSQLPAAKIFKPGDRLLSINGTECKTSSDFSAAVRASEGKPCQVVYSRDNQTATVELTPLKVIPHEIGVGFYVIDHPTPFQQLQDVLDMTWRTLKSLGNTLRHRLGMNSGYSTIGIRNLSGPWSIGKYMIMMFHGSFLRGLLFVVMISYSLGIFNLLPIPVLDGGHILIAILEIIFRRPIPAKILQPVMYFFITVLIGFMVIVTAFDIWKTVPSNLRGKLTGGEKPKTEETETSPGNAVLSETGNVTEKVPEKTQEAANAVAP